MNKLKTNPSAANGAVWFPIDNASNLYCGARRNDWCRTFRLSMVLKEQVNPIVLQQALTELSERMPSFCAKMQDGLFWSYFEHTNPPQLQKETSFPCRPIQLKRKAAPDYRVLYFARRISLEIFHGVADGGASLLFLTALVTRYYELMGEAVSDFPILPRVGETPTEEETADPYILHADQNHAQNSTQRHNVFFEKMHWDPSRLRVIHGIMDLPQVKAASSKHALTVTEYFCAVLILAILQSSEKPIQKPIHISVPINLRPRFDTWSHRNFAYMQPIVFDPRDLDAIDFEAICMQIRGQMKEKTEPEVLRREISANVKAQQNPVLRVIPYPIKRLFLKKAYQKSQQMFTAFISNASVVQAPPEVLQHIERAELIMGDTPYQPFGCTFISANDRLVFTCSDCGGDPAKQRIFFRFLAEDGIQVKIETNEETR